MPKDIVKLNMKKETKPKYYPEIDILKAFAAILVIFIHVIAEYRGVSSLYGLIWDLAHFSVGAFVFASGFLMANSIIKNRSFRGILKWSWKRFIRIYIPYLMFAIIYIIAEMTINGWTYVAKDFSWSFLWNTISMTSGVGNNWIPRLFLWLSFLFLLAEIIKPYFKYIYDLLIAIAFLIAGYFLFGKSGFMVRDQRIAGWFLVFMTGFMYQRFYKKYNKINLWTIIISGISLAVLLVTFLLQEHSLSLFYNKYPTNLYFVVYNIFAVALVLTLIKWIQPKIQKSKQITKIIRFYSHASYDFFFYHLVIMLFIHKLDVSLGTLYVLVVALTTGLVLVKREILNIKI